MSPGKGVPGSVFESHAGTSIFVQSRCGGWCSVTLLIQFLTFCLRCGMEVPHTFFLVRKQNHSKNEWSVSSAAPRRVQPIKRSIVCPGGKRKRWDMNGESTLLIGERNWISSSWGGEQANMCHLRAVNAIICPPALHHAYTPQARHGKNLPEEAWKFLQARHARPGLERCLPFLSWSSCPYNELLQWQHRYSH